MFFWRRPPGRKISNYIGFSLKKSQIISINSSFTGILKAPKVAVQDEQNRAKQGRIRRMRSSSTRRSQKRHISSKGVTKQNVFPDSSWSFINLANANEVSKTSTKHSRATLLRLSSRNICTPINKENDTTRLTLFSKPFKNMVLFQPRFLHSEFVSHYQLSNHSFACFIMEIQSLWSYNNWRWLVEQQHRVCHNHLKQS